MTCWFLYQLDLYFSVFSELSWWKIPVLIAGDGWSEWWFWVCLSRYRALDLHILHGLWCFQLFRVLFAGMIFEKNLSNIFTVDFPEFFQFWIRTFLETIATTLMNGPFIIHWFPLITHDAAQLGFTNLFSWHIWGWNHDAATDYAGVQLVTRQLCLENDLHIANALCVDKAPLLSPFDESIQLIDWLVVGATCYEKKISNNSLK